MKKMIVLEDDDVRKIMAKEFNKEMRQVNIEISSVITDYGRFGQPRVIITINEDDDDD